MSYCCIRYNILRVPLTLKDVIVDFYSNVCGMMYSSENGARHIFSFEAKSCYHPTGICFEFEDNIITNVLNPGYWKVGFALQDVDAAIKHFREIAKSTVGDGHQFVDIGYLTSLNDPAKCCIELLQQTFEENFVKQACERGTLMQPLENLPSLGQITLRCKNASVSCKFYSEVLGMKLLSIQQPAKKYPFTLYFFAYTEDIPPNCSDLCAIENREWLWKQPYTQIELQHRHGTEDNNELHYTTNDVNGNGKIMYGGFRIAVTKERYDHMRKYFGIEISNSAIGFNIQDPDGYTVEITVVNM